LNKSFFRIEVSMGMSERRGRLLAERRERALDNAFDLFRAEDYESITMQDIADASEISKGSLYLQFANKEAIVIALLERTFDKLEEIITKETETSDIAKERLRRIVGKYIEAARTEGCRDFNLWLLSRLPPRPDSPQQELIRNRIERLTVLITRIFDEGARDGTIRGDINPKNLIRLFSLISVLFMERISWVRAVTPIVDASEEALLEEFLGMILYYISPIASPGKAD
jgi:TetR/AcrR family transcriptional regulator